MNDQFLDGAPAAPSESLTLSFELWEEMRRHVAETAPEEACGLVGGKVNRGFQIFPITNLLHSPVRYRMAPEEQLQAFIQMEDTSLELLAIYHSHPLGPDRPSITDVTESYYPEAIYLIWSVGPAGWNCQGFTIRAGEVQTAAIHLDESE
jgi:proteasome lid subunit RPN8/RPN11